MVLSKRLKTYVFFSLQVSNVFGLLSMQNFPGGNYGHNALYMEEWLAHTWIDLRYAISALQDLRFNRGDPARRIGMQKSLDSILRNQGDLAEVQDVFQQILDIRHTPDVLVTIFGDTSHIRVVGQFYEENFYPLAQDPPFVQVELYPVTWPAGQPANVGASRTTHGLNLTDYGGYDTSNQAHILFARFCFPEYESNKPAVLETRPFHEIREGRLEYTGDADLIDNFSVVIVHELSHAISMFRDRPRPAQIRDGKEVKADGIYYWSDLVSARRGNYGADFSTLQTACLYETVFKFLSLSTTRDSRGTRRIVSWTTNKVNRDTLLPIGLDGNAITLAGVRAPRGMRAWRYNP